MQQLLEDEAEVPTLLIAARGERARCDEFLQQIHDGAIPAKEIEGLDKLAASLKGFGQGKASEADKKRPTAAAEKWYDRERINGPRLALALHVGLCRDLQTTRSKATRCFRTAGSDLERTTGFHLHLRWLKGESRGSILAQAGGITSCAVVALAIERYRQANDRWPISLRDLVPQYIARIPADPYDGRPLRYCHVREGVGVYSIGQDRKDDNGDLREPGAVPKGGDLGFRLWNPELRRQAPSPAQLLDKLPGRDEEDDP